MVPQNTYSIEDKEEVIILFDVNHALASMPKDSVLHYDLLKVVCSLQGLVNRREPKLVIRFLYGEGTEGTICIDDYWLSKLQSQWLRLYRFEKDYSFTQLLAHFADFYRGWVIWDPAVPATATIAATICGVDELLPLRADSPLLPYLREGGILLDIKEDLTGKFTGSESGSAKCDAYLWAKRRYLDSGKCNPSLMAFYIDAYTQRPDLPGFHYPDLPNTMLPNHDYFIANRAFFFDLLVWPDETPVDDPTQPKGTDHATLVKLLESQYQQNKGQTFTSIGGFVSWNLKYTNYGLAGGNHEPVPTEWKYVALFSAYNAFLDADALGIGCLTNASAYRHYPLRDTYTQHKRPEIPPLEDKTYVLIYMGDYDSAAWLSRSIPRVWDNPDRGALPIAWAFNPNLAVRVPYVFDYVYSTATPNDWFIAGNSGAGYLNPNLLIGERLKSGIPDALEMWVAHNKYYYEKFDYSITGFVINGFHGTMPLQIQHAYTKFSPDGVGMQLGVEKYLVGKTPFIVHASDIYPKPDAIAVTADEMARFATLEKPQFLVFRWILQTPSIMKQVQEALNKHYPQHNWVFCDPYTFFSLYRACVKKGF